MADEKPPKALAGQLPPIPRDLVVRVGEALYGDDWVSPLARDLGVARLTVQRWKDDKTRVTPFVAPELEQLLAGRAKEIGAALARLKIHVAAAQSSKR